VELEKHSQKHSSQTCRTKFWNFSTAISFISVKKILSLTCINNQSILKLISVFSQFQFLCSPGLMCETEMYISRTENLRSAATETDQIH
jgi:hypothetical protein